MPAESHWPEYVIEATLLGLFMVSACAFTVLFEHPASPVHAMIPAPFTRRALIGIAMGVTAVALIYSPWGKRSGAHFNPSVTLTFLRLGKIEARDAIAYVVAQCIGGIAGVTLMWLALRGWLADPAVEFVVTVPGGGGEAVAFVAELLISFGLMAAVLVLSNSSYASRTGLVCGALVAAYITFEAPLSGMSMNPARTLGSAAVAQVWTGFWIYMVAPILGMLAAAELYVRARGAHRVFCAKLHHQSPARCIFHCGYAATGRS
ncbi:MAG TPA: aquaporin [Candidatus Binatia bacterium]|nr:aquaporin [Candidatus Binatia bacterium]